MLLANDTPFVLERFAVFNKEAAETIVLLLKATFEIADRETPTIAKEQDPINPVDKYSAEPGKSGLIAEGEHIPPKPSSGVTVTAHAVANAPNQKTMTAGVRVGEVLQSAVVHGDRQWDRVLGLSRMTPAQPFERIPLTWENAFGGADETPDAQKHWEFHEHNHVGKGFRAKKTNKPLAGTPLPNIEHPDHPVRSPGDRPPPVGFCPVAPHWQPRAAFTGTYDDKWKEDTAPLLPQDFDVRFFQTAPEALTFGGYFRGGEPCVLLGMTSSGRFEFALPTISPVMRICWKSGAVGVEPRLDTIHIDMDRRRLHLMWRGAQDVHGRLETIDRIEASLNRRGGG
jgi:hypothetical protein